jgi:serine/threonine protein kinase
MPRTCPQCQIEWQDDVELCPDDGTDLNQAEDPLIGSTVGSYQVVRLLGKGGMGSVYLAQHPVIGSKVAIKFLHQQFSQNKKIVDRFFNEARAVNVIGHDNILKILDLSVTADGHHYFVMEFLQGRSLQELVAEGKPVTLEVAGPILLQFCEALQAAHDRKIFHRDIKPENIYLVTHKGRKNFVKVVDFGIAKLTDTGAGGPVSTGTTQTGLVVGTPAYMSPEQAGGMNSKIDARSDIYSAGVLMFQLATGQLPFPSTHFGEVLIGHLQLAPPMPRELNPELSAEWERIILQALSKKQDDRQQSMRELSAQLAELMGTLGISAELPLADDAEPSVSGVRDPKLATPGQPLVARRGRAPPRFGEAQVVPKQTAPKQRSGQTLATRMQRPETALARPPPLPPKRSLTLLWVGAGAVVVVLVATFGLVTWIGSDVPDEAALARAHQAAATAGKAADAAVERARSDAEKNGPVLLSVVSDPLGADVEATWKDGGQKQGRTPMDFRVPRNTKVTFQFKLRGFLPYRADVIADEAQVVKAQLQSEGPRPSSRKAPSDRHKGSKAPVSGDDVIEVGDDIFK